MLFSALYEEAAATIPPEFNLCMEIRISVLRKIRKHISSRAAICIMELSMETRNKCARKIIICHKTYWMHVGIRKKSRIPFIPNHLLHRLWHQKNQADADICSPNYLSPWNRMRWAYEAEQARAAQSRDRLLLEGVWSSIYWHRYR